MMFCTGFSFVWELEFAYALGIAWSNALYSDEHHIWCGFMLISNNDAVWSGFRITPFENNVRCTWIKKWAVHPSLRERCTAQIDLSPQWMNKSKSDDLCCRYSTYAFRFGLKFDPFLSLVWIRIVLLLNWSIAQYFNWSICNWLI